MIGLYSGLEICDSYVIVHWVGCINEVDKLSLIAIIIVNSHKLPALTSSAGNLWLLTIIVSEFMGSGGGGQGKSYMEIGLRPNHCRLRV